MVMAYLAAIRFVDAEIGRFMDALEANPDIFNNTVIVLMSDHGFSLGEKRHWQKLTLWETEIRAPLIIADLRNPVKNKTYNNANFIDIFPTLCDYAGIAYPTFSNGTSYLDGQSLISTMASPVKKYAKPILTTVKYDRGQEGSCFPQYSVRDRRFHYIKYKGNLRISS